MEIYEYQACISVLWSEEVVKDSSLGHNWQYNS